MVWQEFGHHTPRHLCQKDLSHSYFHDTVKFLSPDQFSTVNWAKMPELCWSGNYVKFRCTRYYM